MRPKSQRERRHTWYKITLVLIALAFGLAIFVVLAAQYLDFREFADKFKNINYTYPSEIATIADKLNLTDRGNTIFSATRPNLESSADFNEHCESHNDQISILGCYTDDTIFLYNIPVTSELTGIIESTAAHELLHAVWARLTPSERDALTTALTDTYNDNIEAFSSELNSYASEDRLDEIHSRIGTQIANLPGVLETHYAKYFNDQDAIVELYQHYSAPFKELNDQRLTLSEELNTLKNTIDTKTAEYQTRLNTLATAIDEFNNCANTAGCFTTNSFNQRRQELVSEQTALSDFYNEIDDLINQYNAKVSAYNDSIFQTEKLENTINSNATLAPITE